MNEQPEAHADSPLVSALMRQTSLARGERERKLYVRQVYALRLPQEYRKQHPGWKWGAAAKFLYREILWALGLKDQEELFLQLAESKPGRKEERELAERIWQLRAEGRTVPQIRQVLEREGRSLSEQAVESYLKDRRRKEPSQRARRGKPGTEFPRA